MTTIAQNLTVSSISVKLEGLWKCHIKGDGLLIWQQNDTELILIMTDTETHADLF